MFRYLVLGLLRDGRSRHGYALMKAYKEQSGVTLSTGNFYRELQKLSNDGLVRTVSNPEGADPRRAPYEITPEGLAKFEVWLLAQPRPRNEDYEDELSCRVLFVIEADPITARSVMDRWQEALWITGKMLERTREAAIIGPSEDGASSDALALLVGRRLKHVAADLEFLDEVRSFCEQRTERHASAEEASPAAPPGGARVRRGTREGGRR